MVIYILLYYGYKIALSLYIYIYIFIVCERELKKGKEKPRSEKPRSSWTCGFERIKNICIYMVLKRRRKEWRERTVGEKERIEREKPWDRGRNKREEKEKIKEEDGRNIKALFAVYLWYFKV